MFSIFWDSGVLLKMMGYIQGKITNAAVPTEGQVKYIKVQGCFEDNQYFLEQHSFYSSTGPGDWMLALTS